MSRFLWKNRHAPLALDSPRAGVIKKVSRELAVLADQWRQESLRWPPGDTADQLWQGGWTLSAVLDDLTRGKTTAQDAHEWAVAGRSILDGYQWTRSRREHPAGRAS